VDVGRVIRTEVGAYLPLDGVELTRYGVEIIGTEVLHGGDAGHGAGVGIR